jgi:predicted kinase
MSNKQMTAEWLGKELESYGDPQFCKIKWEQLDSLIQQALELEKQQIIDAYHCGRAFENKYPDSGRTYDESANQYYNESYGGQNNEQ